MRGFNSGSASGGVGMVLKIAPVVCSFFAFVFLAIALSSGSSTGYLEGLSVVNFNMSTFGKNLIGKAPNLSDAARGACNTANNAVDDATNKAAEGAGKVVDGAADAGKTVADAGKNVLGGFGIGRRASPGDAVKGALGGAGDKLGDGIGAACQGAADAANAAVQFGQDAVNKALGSVAKAIGVKEYYSVHIGNLCEGEYKPLFSDPKAEVNVQKCTPKFSVAETDLSKKLDGELSVGPFKFKYSDIGIVDTLQDVLDLIPRLLAAMGFFFLFATLSIAAAFLGSAAIVASDFTGKAQGVQKILTLATLFFLSVGWIMGGIGTVGITFAAEKIKKEVNENGAKFGMSANTSGGLYFLMWTSSILAGIAVACMAYSYYASRHPSGARSGIDEGLDEQKNVARGQYPIMQGTDYPAPAPVGGAAGGRESYYPDEQTNGDGRPSKEYYQQ
ncbi:hypothetical protein QBC43DRAFT_359072 [Cladorrhinum sp. PSN259]|nr:hypothetical protein QBC43DRAFT_359072 [Cladorrhinum sp. PSN259]